MPANDWNNIEATPQYTDDSEMVSAYSERQERDMETTDYTILTTTQLISSRLFLFAAEEPFDKKKLIHEFFAGNKYKIKIIWLIIPIRNC